MLQLSALIFKLAVNKSVERVGYLILQQHKQAADKQDKV
jgi:hypothetical protein